MAYTAVPQTFGVPSAPHPSTPEQLPQKSMPPQPSEIEPH
jgi:hypothetical protein